MTERDQDVLFFWLVFGLFALVGVLGGCHKKPIVKPDQDQERGHTRDHTSAVAREAIERWLGHGGQFPVPYTERGSAIEVRDQDSDDPVSYIVREDDIFAILNLPDSNQLQTVHFDTDSNELSESARTLLAINAYHIKENPRWIVVIDGHTDERGTSAYNLALGQRRGEAIKSYYVALGICECRIHVISYGMEIPFCMDSTEECWRKNRRGVTRIVRN